MPPNGYQQFQQPHAPGQKRFNALIMPLAVSVVLLFLALGFALWAYTGMQDYKSNFNKKLAQSLTASEKKIAAEQEKKYADENKNPLKRYQGPATYGSIDIQYPKTWSAFVTEASNGGDPINGYLHPNFVPGVQSGTAFALRVQVVNQQYAAVMQSFNSQAQAGKLKVSPFTAERVPDVLGSRIEGAINQNQNDLMIVVPLRDKTLKIWTESQDFFADFEKTILPNLLFVP